MRGVAVHKGAETPEVELNGGMGGGGGEARCWLVRVLGDGGLRTTPAPH